MNSIDHKSRTSFVFLLAVLIIYSVLILSFHHYERLTGDATLYLSIAEKYLNGDFENAVNGYWGPLLAWLLIPFLYFNLSHVFAINALNLILGLLTITGVWRLSYRFEIDEKIRSIVLIPLLPVVLFISLIEPMDFLLLCILVYYFNIVFKKDYPDSLFNAVSGGVLGVLAYFSKPYGYPFFIFHFLLINICHYFRSSSIEHKKNVIKNFLAGFIVFVFLSSIWIAVISNKYDRLTFSNMGSGVFASLGPESSHDTLEKGDPIFFKGFFEPPNETAFIIYEDPTYAREKTWNPLESTGLFKHFISNLTENVFNCIRVYESYSRLSIAIVIIYIVLIFVQPLNNLFSRSDMLYPLLTVFLYTGGYMLFHIEARYLWVVNILLLLMGGKALNELFRNRIFEKNMLKNILTGFFIISFVITPVKSITEISGNSLNKKMHTLGTELSERYDISGNIASSRQKMQLTKHDSWHQTFRLSYWLKSRYYGQDREGIADDDLEGELKRFDIDYYFYWDSAAPVPDFLSQYRELTNGEIPGLKIYSLNEKE